MNNLREIKKSRLLHDESFTYMLSSDERTNHPNNPDNLSYFYDLNFGGFREPYEEYKVDVLSVACAGGLKIPEETDTHYLLFIVENLEADGYFCSKVLTNRDVLLSVIPINKISDTFVQNDWGPVSFKIKNARNVRKVRFKFFKSDFSAPDIDDLNNVIETKWILTLKMTPIINDY